MVIESQNRNCVIDGNADDHPRIALGANYANRDNAPTRMYEDGRVYFENGTFGGKVVSSLNAGGFYIMSGADGSNTVSLTPSSLTVPNLPSIDPKVKGMLWRDGTTLKVSLG